MIAKSTHKYINTQRSPSCLYHIFLHFSWQIPARCDYNSLSLIHLVLQFLLVTQITHQQKSLTSAINIFQHSFSFRGFFFIFLHNCQRRKTPSFFGSKFLGPWKIFGLGKSIWGWSKLLRCKKNKRPKNKRCNAIPLYSGKRRENKTINFYLPCHLCVFWHNLLKGKVNRVVGAAQSGPVKGIYHF